MASCDVENSEWPSVFAFPEWPQRAEKMTLPAAVSRFVRFYVLSPEMVIFGVLLLILYNSVNHVRPLRKLVQRARVNLQLRFSGQKYNTSTNKTDYDRDQDDQESNVVTVKDRASWELKRDNAAVFAIQGRRQHMEDRFNVVTDLEHTGASIYGIFDGHGGEVTISFLSCIRNYVWWYVTLAGNWFTARL